MTAPRVQIRLATADDLPAIDAIFNYYVPRSTCTYQLEPEPFSLRMQWFEHHGERFPVSVATVGGEIVGWGAISLFRERVGYQLTVEDSVYVRHDHLGRGIGSALLGNIIQRARALQYHTMIASIDGEQRASLALHRKFHFQTCADMKQVGRKFDRWLDLIYMQLML